MGDRIAKPIERWDLGGKEIRDALSGIIRRLGNRTDLFDLKGGVMTPKSNFIVEVFKLTDIELGIDHDEAHAVLIPIVKEVAEKEGLGWLELFDKMETPDAKAGFRQPVTSLSGNNMDATNNDGVEKAKKIISPQDAYQRHEEEMERMKEDA